MSDIKVFVSYSWGVEEQTKVVDEIEALCPPRNIRLIRDRNEMKHGDLIVDFMDNLTGGEHVITVFSKPYFKSKWCMYELLKIWQKGDFQQRTHPVIVDDCDLGDAAYRMDTVEYWVEEHRKIKVLLEGRDPSLFVEEFKKLNILRDISQNVNELMNFAAGCLITPLADLRVQQYAQILDPISTLPTSFHEVILEEIAALLSDSSLEKFRSEIHAELNRLTTMTAIENDASVLAKQWVDLLKTGGKECPAINKVLRNASITCLDKNNDKSVSNPDTRNKLLDSIERILGYIVLTLVDQQDARDLSAWLKSDLSNLYFELHAVTEGGVEMFISHQQRRPAALTLKDKRKVSGKYLIYVEPSVVAWTDNEKVSELQRLIWNSINDDNIQTSLTAEQLEDLETDLLALYEIEDEDSNYCLAIPFSSTQGADYKDACQEFLKRFKIPLVHFNVGEGQPFQGIEKNLIAAIKLFLNKINQLA